eukprot:scaffold731_cov261-Pinguiococcus_pyrenoidosus.AAC.70
MENWEDQEGIPICGFGALFARAHPHAVSPRRFAWAARVIWWTERVKRRATGIEVVTIWALLGPERHLWVCACILRSFGELWKGT